jgi:hypothetical protein
MHDPQTVAFDIKSPFRGEPSKFWPKGYRNTLVTIWHVDPENARGMCGTRSDDTCGWHTPPYSPADRDRVKKLAAQQYSNIFEKQVRTAEGASYAHICNEPDVHSAVYWSWRAIKHEFRPRGLWQYGCRLTSGERERIYELATLPVDNLRTTFREVKDAETFERLFFSVFRAYIRHHRPWYKHPRWHVWHWRLQIHPWQALRRWLFSRCAGCGKRFPYGYSPVSFQWDSERPRFFCGEVGVYHSECSDHALRDRRQGNAAATAP